MILRRGMHSPDVMNFQRVIGLMGFKLEADGWFGEGTENVVRWFQRNHGLTEDGIAGPKTLAKMDAIYQPGVENFTSSTIVVNEPEPEEDQADAEDTVVLSDPTGGHKRLQGVHPVLQAKTLRVIALAEQDGYTVRVSQGLRTFEEQRKLFEQRPRVTLAGPGRSFHNYGLAVDLYFLVDGKVSWDVKLYDNIGRWAGRVGLEWGGNWRFKDRPHLQLPDLGSTVQLLEVHKNAGGGDAGVAAAWQRAGYGV